MPPANAFSKKLVVALAALLLPLVTSCTSHQASSSTTSDTSSNGSVGKIIVVGGPLSDPFFAALSKGVDQAKQDLGNDVAYTAASSYDNIVPDTAHALQAAISQHPAAIVVGDFFPDSEEPLIKDAVAKGIPVVLMNSGRESWQELGAIGYVGEDPELVGQAAGHEMLEAKKSHGLCVNTIPDNPAVVARCKGFTEVMTHAGSSAQTLNLNSSNNSDPQQIQQAIAGVLRSTPSIDAIYTDGVTTAAPALQAIQATGRTIALGTSDIGVAALNDIKSGSMLFAIDQQPYLQGYYGVLIASQWLQFGLRPVSSVTTGPLVVTSANVDQVLSSAKSGVRGAS